jgi:mRNA-degrading endonuclease toxin of MazEF toxin-antitoxin module
VAEVNRGEIWQFSFPRPDRRRPVLVLTRQDIIGHLHNVTVAPITTTIRDIPTEVVIGTESGLKQLQRSISTIWSPCPKLDYDHLSEQYLPV